MITTNYVIGDSPIYQQGWICPKCGRVYSPNQSMCWYCGGNTTTTTNIPGSTGVDPNWWKPYITCSEDIPITLTDVDTFRVHYENPPFIFTNEE